MPDHPAPTPFGRRLRELRRSAGLKQLSLARRSGVSQAAISRLEGGSRGRRPSPAVVSRLAAALDVTAMRLTGAATL